MIFTTSKSLQHYIISPQKVWSLSTLHRKSTAPLIINSFFGTSSASSTNKTEECEKKKKLIYQRDPKRTLFPRSLLAGSILHSSYWTWYILDFVPALNNSPIEALHVDPTISYCGFVISVLMLGGSVLYPRYLVGEVSLEDDKKVVKCYSLPFVTLENDGMKIKNDSDDAEDSIHIDEISLDARRKLRDEHIFVRGHIPIIKEGMKGHMLLDIKEERNEIKDKKGLAAFLLGWKIRGSDNDDDSRNARKKTDTRSPKMQKIRLKDQRKRQMRRRG